MSDAMETAMEVLRAVGKLLSRISTDDVKRLVVGEAKLAVVSPNWRPAGPTGQRPAPPSVDAGQVASELNRVTDRVAGRRYVESLGMTVPMLRELARGLNVYVPSSLRKSEIIERIVEYTVGRRLSTNAIREGEWSE